MQKEIRPIRPVLPDFESYIEKIRPIWETGILTNQGPLVKEFQADLRRYFNWENVELFVNGHSALDLAIQSLQLKGEVITTPFTFASTVHCIRGNGLKPVFCDIDPTTFCIDPGKIEDLITPETCAIVGVHIFGNPCEVAAIEEIGRKHDLKILYDGAQALGTRLRGKSIGCFGDVCMFSLHAIKIINSIEGGILVFKNKELTRKYELLRNFGIGYKDNDSFVETLGQNAKMNEFQAAMGILNLKRLEAEIESRRKLVEHYQELLKDVTGIQLFSYKEEVAYNYSYYSIRILEKEFGINRDGLWKRLRAQGIYTRRLYAQLASDYPGFNGGGDPALPEARRASSELLDLPVYGELTLEDVELICDRIRRIGKGL